MDWDRKIKQFQIHRQYYLNFSYWDPHQKKKYLKIIHSMLLVFSCSVMSYSILCDPINCSMSGFPVLYCLPEFAEIHFHWVSNAIQQSHPLSPASSPALSLSQHQGLFQCVGSLHQAKVLELHLQLSIQDRFPLGLTGLISLPSKGFSRVFSNTTVQKHQWFSAQPFLLSNSHIYTWLLEKP